MATNGIAKYRFPYPPYDIQNQLMDAIYDAMNDRKVAIVESPTGTGKSLSVICAAIQWLQDFEAKQLSDLTQELQTMTQQIEELDTESKISSDWIELQNKKSLLCQQKNLIIKQLNRFEYKNERNKSLIQRKNNSFLRKKFDSNHKHLTKRMKGDANCDPESNVSDFEFDENFLDYSSDDEVIGNKNESEEDQTFVRPKIYYCSRTHSQLSQFVNEIKKTCYSREERPLRTVVLGSRNNYCINQSVLKLNNNNLINEKCIELQKSGKSETKCQMYKKSSMNELKEEVLADVLDIEDINKLGKGFKACPYYSTRLAIPEAEIVIIPYNILLHSSTRESFGICLKDSVVIVDESHNLIETIHSIHSIELKGGHVIDALTQLNHYLVKYKTRLSAKNTKHVKQIIFILNELVKHFKQSSERSNGSNVVERVQFLIGLKIENLNLYKIIDYCEKSRIARKLFGFCEKYKPIESQSNDDNQNKLVKTTTTGTTAFLAKMKGKSLDIQPIASNTAGDHTTTEEDMKTYVSPLYLIQEFLKALMNTKTNAKIITNIDKDCIRKSSLKYILLNPDSYFKVYFTHF